jgi:hypothetical protein
MLSEYGHHSYVTNINKENNWGRYLTSSYVLGMFPWLCINKSMMGYCHSPIIIKVNEKLVDGKALLSSCPHYLQLMAKVLVMDILIYFDKHVVLI